MIDVNLEKGNVRCSGGIDDILTEYTILTNVVIKEIQRMSNKETAFKVFAEIGKISVKNLDDQIDSETIYKDIVEVISNELQI